MPHTSKVTNWAQTFSSHPRVLQPIDTVETLAAALESARQQNAAVRILGAGQSPNDIALSNEHLLAIRRLNRIREIDCDRCEVVAEAGISLGALAAALGKVGLALPNLSSILRQSLGGAAATGTHGTGLEWGSLSTWIEAFEMVTVDGTLLQADRTTNPELWSAGRLSLGSLGVQTAFRLKVVPDFDLRVEEGPVDLATAMQPAWYGAADHARVWYLPYVHHAWGWRAFRVPHQQRHEAPPHEPAARSWFRDRLLGYHGFQAGLWLAGSAPSLLPAVNRAYSNVFFSQPKNSTGGNIAQFTFDCLFHQRVAEWAVPVANANAAVDQVREMAERQGFRAHLPIEFDLLPVTTFPSARPSADRAAGSVSSPTSHGDGRLRGGRGSTRLRMRCSALEDDRTGPSSSAPVQRSCANFIPAGTSFRRSAPPSTPNKDSAMPGLVASSLLPFEGTVAHSAKRETAVKPRCTLSDSKQRETKVPKGSGPFATI